MNIGLIGTGHVSQKLGKLLTEAGHSVRLGSRNPVEREEALIDIKVKIETYSEVAQWAEVVIIGIPYDAMADVLPSLRYLLADKIVIDATNPINPDWSPKRLGEQHSAGEEVKRLLPQSQVVKAFNTVFADMMKPEKLARVPGGVAGFYCGDDSSANQTVGKLIEEMNFHSVEVGGIENARYLEAMAHLNIQLALGMGGGTNAAFGYAVV